MKTKGNKLTLAFLAAAVLMLAMSINVLAAPQNLQQVYISQAGLTVLDATKTSIKLAWGDQGATTGTKYTVEMATDMNFTNSQKWETTELKCEIKNLSPATKYYVRVIDATGAKSETCVCATAPENVQSISFSDASDGKMTITWTPVSGVDGYAVVYAGKLILAEGTSCTLDYVAGNTYAVVYGFCKNGAELLAYSENGLRISGLIPLTTKIAKKDFGVYSYTSLTRHVSFAALATGGGLEFELTPMKGKGKKTVTTASGIADMGNLKPNLMYKYRVRAFVNLSTGKKTGAWSEYRYISSVAAKLQRVPGGVKIMLPKTKGISRAAIYVSTTKEKGYKKCATLSGLKKAKSCTVRKYGKKSLSKYKTYWFQVRYYANSKKSSESDVVGSRDVYFY